MPNLGSSALANCLRKKWFGSEQKLSRPWLTPFCGKEYRILVGFFKGKVKVSSRFF